MLLFLSVIENIVVLCHLFCLRPRAQSFYTQLKSYRGEKNSHDRSLQESNARSSANQSMRTIVLI